MSNLKQKALVTVVMRTKNSDWVVAEALKGLFSQDFRDFELLVVDSGSTDSTLDILNNYPHRLIQIRPEEYYPGPVLNRAIAAAQGEIIVFQNSDVVPLNAFALSELIQPLLSNEQTVASFARQLPRPEAETWVKRDYAVSYPEQGSAPEWQPFSLPFAAMRKSTWRCHPFYANAWGSEDSEWGYWARKHGYSIAYVPSSEVMHSHNYSLRQIYGRRFIEGEADAFIYGQKPLLLNAAKSYLGSLRNDLKWHLKARDWKGLALSPIRRAVFHQAHYKGLLLGYKRIQANDMNAATGQQVVLSRYEN